MQRILRIIVTLVIVASIIAYMTTFSVRFTETAVVTTFGKADDSSVKKESGLHFKLPYPIQSVTRYDTRVRLLETKPETVQTADAKQVVMTAFVTWRVSDPLVFFQRFSNSGTRSVDHYREAEKVLQSKLRSVMALTGSFALGDLLSPVANASKFGDLEGAMLGEVTGKAEGGVSLADYGIEPVALGISSVKLPEATTEEVFKRMGADRDKRAAEIGGKGSSTAAAVRTQGESEEKKILAFAEAAAQEIRKRGDAEAAQYLEKMNEAPELAVFLKNIDFLREFYAKAATLVMPTNLPGWQLFRPDAMERASPSGVPLTGFEGQPAAVVEGAKGGRP